MGGKTSPNIERRDVGQKARGESKFLRCKSPIDTARISKYHSESPLNLAHLYAKALKDTRIRPSFISANLRTSLYALRTSKQRPLRISCLPTLEAAVDGLARISRSFWASRIGPLLPFAAIRSCLLPRECSGAHS